MSDVFVSYKAEDRRRVQLLVTALEAEGLSVWWDTHIGGAAAWRETIEHELNAAKCVIVVWSARSIGASGSFVRDEASRAWEKGTYLPVKIDDCRPPLGFGETQALPLIGWRGKRADARYQAVLTTAQAIIEGGPRPAIATLATNAAVSRRTLIASGAVAAAAVASLGWLALRQKAVATSNRIAVLPFANLSGDPAQAYFSDGIAEEIRSSLTAAGMQVIGRTSSDAVKDLDTKDAAAKLGVGSILTGSVRRSSSTIRINAQLLNGADGVERWAQSYDRQPGDIIKIQTDIALNVAEALSVALGGAGWALAIGGTTNSAAQDLYFRAANAPGDDEATRDQQLAWLDSAISLDPKYAGAIAFKAALLSIKADFGPPSEATRGFDEALTVANQAIAIEPRMAFGYSIRSMIEANQLQIGRAFADAKRAVELPGANGNVLYFYAGALHRFGSFDEAMRFNAKAIALDPLDPDYQNQRAGILSSMRRYPEAVAVLKRSLEINPQQSDIPIEISNALLLQGKFDEAKAENTKLHPNSRLFHNTLISARKGQRSQALAGLKVYESLTGGSAHYGYAVLYAQLGMKDEAFAELEKAWDVRDDNLAGLRIDPFMGPLRGDPRLGALERKIGLS
jgi:TolB-like protein/tetratricopeptide (TPR) repeat protein